MYEVELKTAELDGALSRLFAALGDLTPAMQEIGEMLVANTEADMDAGIGPDGTPHAPRSQATLDAYAKREEPFTAVPLIKSGTMRRTLFYQVGPDSVEYGSNAIQAAVMQFGADKGAFGATASGGPIPWGRIPARPFIGVSEKSRTGIIEIVEEWLEDAIED